MKVSLKYLDIPTPDGLCDAHLAVPDGEGQFPGVLFLMDAFGVRPVIDTWLERIAGEGYVVLAPNLLYRSKRSPIVEDVKAETTPENRGKLFQSLMPMMSLLTPENITKDAKAYIEALHAQPETAKGPIGVSGYCMGARFALRTAATYPGEVGLVAGFHGGNLATDQPDSIHLTVSSIKAEVYLAYADHDESANPEQQKRMSDALEAAGIRHESVVYPEAAHGYTMSDTAAYQAEAAERHFTKLIELLDRNLK